MLTLVQSVLRVAHGEDNVLPTDHKKIEKKLKPLTADVDEIEHLAEYLEELHAVDPTRAADWLRVIRACYSETWSQLVGGSEAINEENAEENTDETTSADVTDELDDLNLDVDVDEDSSLAEIPPEEPVSTTVEPTESTQQPVMQNSLPESTQDVLPNVSPSALPVPNESEPVISPDELQMTADSDFALSLFNESTENPHYAVFMNGKPLAQFNLLDQDRPEEIKDAFVSEEFADHVAQTLSQFSPAEVLDSLKAKYYHAVVSQGKVAERAANAAEERLEDQYIARLAALKENLLNTVQLVVQASNKGSNGQFIKNNLKAALRQALREAGIANPMAVIDSVWQKHAGAYFSAIFDKAEEWLGYSPEALHEVTQEVLGSNPQEDTEEVIAAEDSAIQANFNARANGIFNVPIKSENAMPPQVKEGNGDLRAHYKSIVGKALRRRHTAFNGV